MLISRMQTNADQVEKDILETQSRLRQVSSAERGAKGKGSAVSRPAGQVSALCASACWGRSGD